MLTTIENINNKDIIDLSVYEKINSNIKTINVTDEISEITITSNNIITNTSIVVKERRSNLLINIIDLNINSGKEIALDLRGDNSGAYKVLLIYTGKNNITSEGNIGICISNNRAVEIIGENNGILKVNTVKGNTAIGNDFSTCGLGNLTLSGSGYIEVLNNMESDTEGKDNRGEEWKCKVGFYNGESIEESIIKIIDNVSLRVCGEEGVNRSGDVSDNGILNGGDAISIYGMGSIKNESNGIVQLVGGKGGYSTDKYGVTICGNGGNAINIKDGNLSLIGFTTLVGGDSGFDVKNKSNKSIKSGYGGSCINFSGTKSNNIKKIRISNYLLSLKGSGYAANKYSFNKDIIDFYGGFFVNSNENLIEIVIENRDIISKKILGSEVFVDRVKRISDIRELYIKGNISNIYNDINKIIIDEKSKVRNLQVDNKNMEKLSLLKKIKGLFKK